jgi:membrane protein implicated in regulation of membrane protease activity
MSSRPALPMLIAGVFFLLWAAIFLTWAPMDTLRLVSGIIFVPIGLALILKYLVVVALIFRRHDAKSRAPQTLHQSTEQRK